MRAEWLARLACPRSRAGYDLDPVRVAGDEVVEGFLVSQDARKVRPLVAGVAILPRDLWRHLRRHGNVYRRTPINDPRVARLLLGVEGHGHDRVPFDEVVGHYRDLAAAPPPGYATDRHPADVSLVHLFARTFAPGRRPGCAVVVGCGVGRTVFDLTVHWEAVLGIDRSVACVRRARNIAVTNEHFFLPAPRGSGLKEIALELARLERSGADFAVADADALPLADACADAAVLFAGDTLGPWPDAAAAAREAARVVRPGGTVFWHVALDAPVTATGTEATDADGDFRSGLRP